MLVLWGKEVDVLQWKWNATTVQQADQIPIVKLHLAPYFSMKREYCALESTGWIYINVNLAITYY